ncbi:MAG: four helix bundle protein [Chloroflexota bacterium]
MDNWKTYSEWAERLPEYLTSDKLWEFEVYRKALFLHDLTWRDCDRLQEHSKGKHLVSQLLRSAGSVSANIEEGYGRGFGKDYARFLRIALGSAREVRGWYFRSRLVLDEPTVSHRISLLTEIISGLTVASNYQRKR